MKTSISCFTFELFRELALTSQCRPQIPEGRSYNNDTNYEVRTSA
jgi:hypothetical protein